MLYVALSLACGYAGGLYAKEGKWFRAAVCWYTSTCFALDGAESLSR